MRDRTRTHTRTLAVRVLSVRVPSVRVPSSVRVSSVRVPSVLLAAGLLTAVTACAEPGEGAHAESGAHGDEGAEGVTNSIGVALPEAAQHVHGAGVDPGSGDVLVASHAGLYTVPAPDQASGEATEPVLASPEFDLMGFAVQGPDHYLASGHPEGEIDMPDPVGLIETRDGGQTWEALSLAGESDFHALASVDGLVVGFDGALRATEDGTEWTDLQAGVEAFALAVSDDGETILATTERGPVRSTDGGEEFTPLEGAPPLALVDWVHGGETVFGFGVDGGVYRSDDAGTEWERTGTLEGNPEALYADDDQVIVVADLHVARSTDDGATFDGW